MCDPAGFVVEGTMSNVFAVSGGTLVTPDLSRSGVAGVMRAEVMAVARRLGLRCQEVRITAAELEGMDEIFLTNSIIGVWPVIALGSGKYSVGDISRMVRQCIREAQCFAFDADVIAANSNDAQTLEG